MSFFSQFHKNGATAIRQQDIKVKTVKVSNNPTVSPQALPIIAQQRPTNQRSTPTTPISTLVAIPKPRAQPPKIKSGLLSPPGSTADRGRESKGNHVRSTSRDIVRDRSLKRKESSSSFQRLDSPSTTTSSLRSVSPSNDSVTSHPKKRRLTPSAPHHRNSPIQERLVSSDEESASESDSGTVSASIEEKRRRLEEAKELGLTDRIYMNPKSFKSERMCFVHADQIANGKKEGYRRVFHGGHKIPEVALCYPAMPLYERYVLVQHRDGDEFSPIGDITATIEIVATHMLSEKQRIPVTTEDSGADGILRLIRRSRRKSDPELLQQAVEKYNKLIRTYRKSGVFQRNIEKLGKTGVGIPLPFAEHILTQSYARSVALDVDSLRKYEAFSNNVYGELLPKFTSKLFKEAKLRHDQVFVDLGSGTGNVVLHAALEVGCESWGCEMMEKACELADAQAREFEARCILWGLKPGKVKLEKGDFLENVAIPEVLKRADVLLVNNYAFDSTLNARLVDMFLDLKEGTQIISLKSFVPPNHVITPRNVDSPVNLLRVEEKEYFSGCVSWTNAPGRYYVATVDRSMLRAFEEK